MRIVLAALATAALSLMTSTADADPPPWWANWPPPQLPPDVARVLQAAQSCPPVEIAPGISVPIPCASALPKPPVDAPTVDLPLPVFAPLAVDLRAQGLDGPVKDQQQTGVCFAFALTTVLENSMRRQGRQDVLSPLHFVAEDGWADLWRSAPREGISPEWAWPYDPVKACRFLDHHDSCEQTYGVAIGSWQYDPRLVAERENVKRAVVAWSGQARVLKNRPVDQIVAALASGRAVYAQIDIDSVAWDFRGVRGGVLPEYARADRGGHAVAIVGYRTLGPARQFLLHNSWGTDWGDRGYAWMSEAGLRAHLIDAEVVEAGGPVATQAPSPVASSCGQGTVLDLATGKCAAKCPSGLPPFNGTCWMG